MDMLLHEAQLLEVLTNFLLVFIVLLAMVLLYRFSRSKVLDFVIALGVSTVSSEVLKYFINKPRPVSLLEFEGSGFPSTHTTIAFTIFFFYILLCHKLSVGKGSRVRGFVWHVNRIVRSIYFDKYAMFIGAAAMSISYLRIYVKAHDIYDVLGGILLAVLITVPFVFYDFSLKKTL